jgi:wyosine [tRNA(Phe)-imidazoG37] synthetase (radical SAM superfamily)
MKYIYGPVKSRRLGLSLGVSLSPHKICDFDCIYCQLGQTQEFTRVRKEFVKIEEILNELNSWLKNNAQEAKSLNYITLSGLGEPTLNLKIGNLIQEIKKIASCPVAVITNASLLNDKEVRSALADADLIVPSLDTVIPEIFKLLKRPLPQIRIDEIIQGLASLKNEFPGKIWLEVMIVKGVNDDLSQIKKLKEVIQRINPHKIQINSPVRTTAEPFVFPVSNKKLEKIKEILGDKCEII